MTTRISDERRLTEEEITQLIEWTIPGSSTSRAVHEVVQSRALVTELRALAERMGELGHVKTCVWLPELRSLLSAHGGAEKP